MVFRQDFHAEGRLSRILPSALKSQRKTSYFGSDFVVGIFVVVIVSLSSNLNLYWSSVLTNLNWRLQNEHYRLFLVLSIDRPATLRFCTADLRLPDSCFKHNCLSKTLFYWIWACPSMESICVMWGFSPRKNIVGVVVCLRFVSFVALFLGLEAQKVIKKIARLHALCFLTVC